MIFFGKTDVGRKRNVNQDYFITKQLAPNVLLCVVCDGMGGVNGGNIASEIACEAFVEKVEEFVLKTQEDGMFNADSMQIQLEMTASCEYANEKVYNAAKESNELDGMGTTIVAAFFYNNKLYTLNVGDSRAYFIDCDGEISQITKDHSYVQRLVDLKEISEDEAMNHPHKNIITRAVGVSNSIECDNFYTSIEKGEHCCILLCSDGLSNLVPKKELAECILSDMTLEEKTDTLIAKANAAGGNDNITVVLIETENN